MQLLAIRSEIEHMRRQILRQRKEIRDLQRAGISTSSAEELLERMQAKVDGLCAERDRQLGEQRRKYPGTNKVINGPSERRFR
jgi:cell division protein FtsL